jgi:hypothetical protein
MKSIVALLLLTAVLFAVPTHAQDDQLPSTPAGKTWKLVWQDEFDGTTLDDSKWDIPEYIKLSDEIGNWGGDIQKAKLPDQFLVDYVRVYDLVEKD